MPSEILSPVAAEARADRSFEVLLHTLPGTRDGLEGRWYMAGPFAERLDALVEYDLLCREFGQRALVVLVLVAVVWDEETGLYRDRILEARGRAPLIRRERMVPLTAAARKRLLGATAPLRTLRGVARPPAPRRGWDWRTIAVAGAVVGVLAGAALWAVAAGLGP